MKKLTYAQLADIIVRMPEKQRSAPVTIVDHMNCEAFPVEGFYAVKKDNEVCFMDGILDTDHPVLSIRLEEAS